jgi:hypothetical protein
VRGVSQKFLSSSEGSNTPAVHVGVLLVGGVTGDGVLLLPPPPPQPVKAKTESALIIASDSVLFLNMLSTSCK